MIKSKGSNFERELCKRLSLWWTNDERDDVFWRTSQSGGRATERQKKGQSTAGSYGDMKAEDEIGKPFENTFVVEFKKGYNTELGVLSVIDSKKKSVLFEWWAKNENIVKEAGRKHGLIIFRRDYRRDCIAMDSDLFAKFEGHNGEWKEDLIGVNFVKADVRLVILPLDSFLSWCSPETIRLITEET